MELNFKNHIPIVFCFDNNFAKPAFVTIASLLHYANKQAKHKIYCVVSSDLTKENKNEIQQLESKNAEIVFIEAHNDFVNAHQHRSITEASYYRLMLHKLIPEESKIIYSDVDVLFNGDLAPVYKIDLGNNILAGVKNLYIHQVFEKNIKNISYWKEVFSDTKNTYINAGFLVMNLDSIRKTEIWKEWLNLSTKTWEYHDQDILNMTCKDRILFIPPKYNATYAVRAKGANNWKLFSQAELSETPVVYHFTASKPWNAKYMKQANVWWYFVKKQTNMYPYFIGNYNKIDTLRNKIDRVYRRFFHFVKRGLSLVLKGNK